MIKIGKYEFESREQFETKLKALGTTTDEDGNEIPSHPHVAVRLGHIVKEQGEYNEDGEVTKEAVYSTKYAVDVAFKDLESHPYGWKSFAVEVEGNGVHGFAGIDYQTNKF